MSTMTVLIRFEATKLARHLHSKEQQRISSIPTTDIGCKLSSVSALFRSGPKTTA